MGRITVFIKDNCKYCDKLKDFLQEAVDRHGEIEHLHVVRMTSCAGLAVCACLICNLLRSMDLDVLQYGSSVTLLSHFTGLSWF
jgi:glutaredoxin